MRQYAIIIRDGAESHRLLITHRDWGILSGPLFNIGQHFSDAFGVYENFTVAGGVPAGSRVTRRGRVLHQATQALLFVIKRDSDLLGYDYSYGFADERTRHSGGQGIQIRGRSGTLSTRPKGYCSIELLDNAAGPPRIAEFIDLRIVANVKTDAGDVIKVHRRKAEMHWLETLPPLLEFLRGRFDKDLVVEHHERQS